MCTCTVHVIAYMSTVTYTCILSKSVSVYICSYKNMHIQNNNNITLCRVFPLTMYVYMYDTIVYKYLVVKRVGS